MLATLACEVILAARRRGIVIGMLILTTSLTTPCSKTFEVINMIAMDCRAMLPVVQDYAFIIAIVRTMLPSVA